MFEKILIANRGEIACRIIRTARRMGIATVAVYSDADREALHVGLADEAIAIGPAPAAESYLVIEKIVEACRQSGAQAVHPGYGFLSERESFARALEAAGITFIGPNPRAIAAMGDKIESKRAAAAAGVSTVPGYLGVIENAEHAVSIADAIGYPVMIKASAGGGGKGMRIAHSAGEVAEGFTRARSEAASSFGDDRVFIEKFIVNPRHIEIQVLGDRHGHVIHLGERECSIQRRNQKVIEEAPSPLLDAGTRAAMGAQAVALAQAVGYDSAGTVEFVAGQDRSFYFLEMNTRLQVEHPVTELITGIDLVEQMIRVAAGEPLSLRQEDVTFTGWAVESRVYAEDPARGFLPSVGRLVRYRPPAEGIFGEITVRNDTGVQEGGDIPIHYDPMIAKLVTHGPTRAAAIDAQAMALDAFHIEGIRHNLVFLAALMGQARWRAGDLSTGYIADAFPQGFSPVTPAGALASHLAAVAFAIDHVSNLRKRAISQQMEGWRAAQHDALRLVDLGDDTFAAEVRGTFDSVEIAFVDGDAVTVVSEWRPGQPVWHGTVAGVKLNVRVLPDGVGLRLIHGGCDVRVRVLTPVEAAALARVPHRAQVDGDQHLLCPMPGVVRQLWIAVGQQVKAGDPLVMVEAMKMENVLRAERDATISAIHVVEGQSLAVDAMIAEFAAVAAT